jgi:nicotinamide mononucleotide transporter
MEFINNILQYGQKNWIKILAMVTSLICVWLNKKEDVRAFPFAIVACGLYILIFYEARFYADMGLQVVFIALNLQGWYQWKFGGESRTELRISHSPKTEILWVIGAGIAGTAILFFIFSTFTDAYFPFWDSFNAAFSLSGQYLLNRKRLENWLFWIVVDTIYVPVFFLRPEYETMILYCSYLILAIQGYQVWRKKVMSYEL